MRFDDRVTGKVEAFAKDAKIIHVDIDAAELNKNKTAHIPVRGDVKAVLTELNKIVEAPQIAAWKDHCSELKTKYPLTYDKDFDGILQQHAITELHRLTADRDTFITVGVGQHQMWAGQFYKFKKPRRWHVVLGSGNDGLWAARGDGRPSRQPGGLVVDIDGDGSFQMNIQELATCYCEKLPVKTLLLNNQHLGMVVQWEDRFMERNRAHTYLGSDRSRRSQRAIGRRPSRLRRHPLPGLRQNRPGLRLRGGHGQSQRRPDGGAPGND